MTEHQLTTAAAKPAREKRIYSYFQALLLSFYSAKLYVDVAKRWRGVGILYLLFLCVMMSIPLTILNIVRINNYYNHHIIVNVKKIPDLIVKDGVVSIAPRIPYSSDPIYTVVDEQDNQPFIIIDTTGKMMSLDNSPAKVLITNNKIVTKLPGGAKPLEQTIGKEYSGTVTADDLLKILDNNRKILYLTFLPSTIIMTFIAELFTLYIFAFIGIYLSTVFLKFKLKFRISLRLTCVAATPEVFFLTLLYLTGWMVPAIGLVLFGLLFGYFLFAVRAYEVSSQQLVVV